MSTIDLSQFVEENETAETRAYKHALDISYQIVEEIGTPRTQSENARWKNGHLPRPAFDDA